MTFAAKPLLPGDLENALLDALEASFDCVKIVGHDGCLSYINVNGCTLMELSSPSDVLGAQWPSFWPERQRPAVEQALAQALAGRPQRLEAPCPTGAGTPKLWDVVIAPLRDSRGQVAAALVTSRDITAWRQAEDDALQRDCEIQAKAAALRSAGEVAKIGGWEVDCHTRDVVWSDETWKLFRGAPRRIAVEEALEVYQQPERERVRNCLEAARRKCEPFRIEVEAIRFDGSRMLLRIFGEPVVEDGVCVRIRGAAQDISEIVAADELRVAAERRLNVALEIAEIHVFELDYKRHALFKGGAEASFFEQPQTFESLSRHLGEVIHPDDRPRVRAEADAAARRKEPLRTTFRMARSDGQEIWVSCALAGRRDAQGELVRVVCALKNITDRVQAHQELIAAKDAAEAASHAKSAFLANVSHEIRTPLNGIMGMAQVMRLHELTPEQEERLRVILSSGETLMSMLNDVLDLSKIEAGRLQLEEHPFELEETVTNACASFAALAAGKDIRFGNPYRSCGPRIIPG